ncbi:hypothetical protein NIES2119_13410 [[Phormidium ambiguum] IAM M-71]|uniref:Uncharacterized protein n=1 Tax=[Phormidium ambiguum] IAM M-71 TaxID=454136 RepID=A0A1U7IKK0_9CYAN|nr:hypothetical protein [Phormidium ambiguum]OKH37695.1 hypothetical protein NIES2119_13410 [Phormidium ambiguum IAM M-71]
MNFQDVLNQAMQLSTVDKVRLIQQMAMNIEREVGNGQSNAPQPPAWNQSQPPAWTPPSEGQRLSNQEVDQARWEDWANFPD